MCVCRWIRLSDTLQRDDSHKVRSYQGHFSHTCLKCFITVVSFLKSYICKCLMSSGVGQLSSWLTPSCHHCWVMIVQSFSLIYDGGQFKSCYDGSRLFHDPVLNMTFRSPYSVHHMCRFIFGEVLHMSCSYIQPTIGLLCIILMAF